MHEPMTADPLPRPQSLSRRLGPHQDLIVDVAFVAVSLVFGLADLAVDWGHNGTTFSWTSAVVITVACSALLLRRTYPLAVLIVVWCARPLIALDVNTEVALSIPAAVALYSFARRATRRWAAAAALGASLVAALSIRIVAPDKLIEETVTEVLFALLVSAVAEVVRSHEERTSERVQAATTARLQAERLRFAHDLHDGIAHSLSNIAVQSGVASRLIDTDPEHAKRALEIINQAGRESLDELRDFLGLLRSEEPPAPARPPEVTMDDVRALIRGVVQAGGELDFVQHGAFPEAISPPVVDAAYRILQESLKNVARHAGPVPTVVDVTHTNDRVIISITNESGTTQRTQVPSTGVGIIGMTERAEALGGDLTAQPTATGFEVRASLPYALETADRP